MAEKSFPLNNTDYGAEDAQLFFATRTRGVFAGDHLGVTPGEGMTVSLGTGIAWLKNGDFGGLVYANTEPLSLTIGLADAIYPRVDRVVIRYDVQQNSVYAYVKPGVPASSPVPAELERSSIADEISVAQVYVGVAATAIGTGNITDERLNMAVCGLMRDGVTGIDTSVIEAQWKEKIRELDFLLEEDYGETLPVIVSKKITSYKKTSLRIKLNETTWNPSLDSDVSMTTIKVPDVSWNESMVFARPNYEYVNEFFEAGVFVYIPGDQQVMYTTKTPKTFEFFIDVLSPVRTSEI